MIDLQLWLVIITNTSVDRTPLRSAHQEYMADLVESGVIFASGPTFSESSAPSNGGTTILRVEDQEQAQRIMDAEPYIKGGARTYELLYWNVRHGNFASSQDSTGQLGLPS